MVEILIIYTIPDNEDPRINLQGWWNNFRGWRINFDLNMNK